MTTFERFERDIPELMTELAPAQVPDYFDDLLRQTASNRQRPAWSYPERWLPMGVLARTAPMRPLSWRPILILALIGALIAAGLAVYVGSRQTRLPPPFGAAGNGVLLYRTADGSVVSLDPRTGSQATIAPGSAHLGDPIVSRDGRRIALLPITDRSPVQVAEMDGSDVTSLQGDYRGVAMLSWSPDDTQVAFVVNDVGVQSIAVAASDGSSSKILSLDREVSHFSYLPDGRLAVVAAERPGDRCPGEDPSVSPCALYLVNPDGIGLDLLIPADSFHGINTIDPSADGSRLLWVEWTGASTGRLHVYDLSARADRMLPLDSFPGEFAINRAWFSPDGSSILFDLFEVDGDHWAVIPSGGGPITRIGKKWPAAPQGSYQEAFWAPDGRSVLSRFATSETAGELWVLDATGGGADQRLDVEVPYLPSWQRVAPGS